MNNPHTGAPVSSPGFDHRIECERVRDSFAGRAMATLLQDVPRLEKAAESIGVPFGDFVGQVAYEVAVGMMKARKALKSGGKNGST